MEIEKLNLIPNGFKQTCYCSQGDDGRVIRFELLEGISPYILDGSEVITNSVKKPNGDTIITSVPNTELAYIDVTINADITELAGVAEGEVTITKAGAVIGTQNYILEIEPDAYGADVEQRTATGIIATFTTNIIDTLEIEADIEPKQDLHGYSKPWAEGDGLNKLDYNAWKTSGFIRATGTWDNNGVTITATENDGYTQYNAPNFNAKVPVSAGDDVYISWQEDTNKDGQIYLFTSRNGQLGARINVNNAYAKSLHYVVTAEDEGFISFRFGVTNQGETIAFKNIQINIGAQADTWTPYANICEISGATECSIVRAGKNLFNKDDNTAVLEAYISTKLLYSATSRTVFIPCKPNTTYTVSKLAGARFTIGYTTEQPANNVDVFNITSIHTASSLTVTTGANAKYLVAFVYNSAYDTVTFEQMSASIQIEQGSEASTYEAYSGAEIVIDLNGTIYGGKVNNNGLMTVNKAFVDLGSLTYSRANTVTADKYRFGASVTPLPKKTASSTDLPDLLCEAFEVKTPSQTYNNSDGVTIGNTDASLIYIYSEGYSAYTPAEFKSAMSGLHLAYELAEPFEVQLTGAELEALLGVNNVWASTGAVKVNYLYRAVDEA